MDGIETPDSDPEPDSSPPPDAKSKANTDASALVEALIGEDVLRIDEHTDTVTTTAEFEDTYAVYLDTYLSVPQEEFVGSVGEVFGLDSVDDATRRIEELGVTREQFAAYLALRSVLDSSYDVATRSRMAVVVADLEPETPVPGRLERIDDAYEEFVATHDQAIVTVWARRCDPCEAMKDDLDAIIDTLPREATVAGIDGDTAVEFCAAHEVDAAPAVVFFEDGRHRRTVVGREPPDRIETIAESVYG